MVSSIDINEFNRLRQNIPVIDVRSPAEFQDGHIPGAVNLPLFNDEERRQVGITYAGMGKDAAVMTGLELIGGKLADYVKTAQNVAPEKSILLHCWRGGLRSESMAWLLDKAGFNVRILSGGYRNYRKYVRQVWNLPVKLIILSGKTGSGKTEILHHLQRKGEQTIDLEKLACHRGSVFGALGMSAQPSTEQFENNLAELWIRLNPEKPVWMEDENRAIGRIQIPDLLYKSMKQSPVILLDIPKNLRIERLVKEYAVFPLTELREAVLKLQKRLGGDNLKKALQALQQNDFHTVADTVLTYYDKAYEHDLLRHQQTKILRLSSSETDPEYNATLILEFLKNNPIFCE